MALKAYRLAVFALCVVFSRHAGGAPQKGQAAEADRSASVQEKTVWTGMSRWVEPPKQKTKNPLHETTLKITKRDGERFEAEYWITLGPNRGGHEQRGLLLSGTINKQGKTKASPTKILAGSWQNPDLLSENWRGAVVEAAGKADRIVLRRQAGKGTCEIGVSKT